MSLQAALLESFTGKHPADAARVLESLSDADAAGVLARVPAETAAGVLGSMVSFRAASLLTLLPDELAAKALEAIPTHAATAACRCLDASARSRVMETLAPDTRRRIERVLRYPVDTAGALMETRVLSFHEKRTVGDVLAEIATASPSLRFYVYIVGDDDVLRGVLSLRELMSESPDTLLASVMKRPVESLPARAPASTTVQHPAWSRLPILPVVDEKGRLVGVLRYETFRRLQEAPIAEAAPSPLGVALALGELFWLGASGLFRGLEGERRDAS